jgi:disulfide bond formation protein DsbB
VGALVPAIYLTQTVTHLAIHCGPTGGSFGCDMGDLPAPPVAFAWLLFAVAVLGLLLGVYMVVTGRLLVRFGTLKGVSTPRGTRLLGLALILDSFAAALIAQGINLLSQHLEPPRWFELVFVALILVAALQWLAFRSDRRPGPAPR